MKILELTRSYYPSLGGMEKFVADRVKMYEYLGYEYQIITTSHSEKQLPESAKLNNVIYLPTFTPYGIVSNLTEAMKIDYDVLSVNQLNYYYSWQSIRKAKKNRKKIILTPHFSFHTRRHKLFKSFHNKFIVPKILESVDKIICFTKYEADYWKSYFPFSKNIISIIPHYFSFPDINPSYTKDYGTFLLYIGRGEVNKRIDLLIKAFDKIKSNYHLVLTVSEEEISKELNTIVKYNRNIHLLGRVPETVKQNLLFSCSTLILPTDFEAFGIVNLEASYYFKPLLLSELPVFKDILDNRGVIYFKNNLTDIENSIRKFIKLDNLEKEKMGKINFNNLQKYSFEKVSEEYVKLFKNLIF